MDIGEGGAQPCPCSKVPRSALTLGISVVEPAQVATGGSDEWSTQGGVPDLQVGSTDCSDIPHHIRCFFLPLGP